MTKKKPITEIQLARAIYNPMHPSTCGLCRMAKKTLRAAGKKIPKALI